jgi:hypothetical protein
MKKIKILLSAFAFILAISASFAFKPTNHGANNAYLKSNCFEPVVECPGGATECVIGGTLYYEDEIECEIPAKMQP